MWSTRRHGVDDRARDDVGRDGITLRADDGVPTIALSTTWADAHPRALHLLRDEAEAWAKAGAASAPRLVLG